MKNLKKNIATISNITHLTNSLTFCNKTLLETGRYAQKQRGNPWPFRYRTLQGWGFPDGRPGSHCAASWCSARPTRPGRWGGPTWWPSVLVHCLSGGWCGSEKGDFTSAHWITFCLQKTTKSRDLGEYWRISFSVLPLQNYKIQKNKFEVHVIYFQKAVAFYKSSLKSRSSQNITY